MFFPERIRRIGKADRVLEIGPGSDPHPRSDVLLERAFAEDEALKQRGGTADLVTTKTLVHYDGGRFPFDDHEFDYVICSHVIEHVEDVESFCAEMFRVARRGYLEYPTLYYEYLYNFSVHRQLINFVAGELRYMAKTEAGLQCFQPVNDLFHRTLELGYSDLVEDLKGVMFQGFEWDGQFTVRKAVDLSELALQDHSALRPLPPLWRYLRRLLHKLAGPAI